MHVLCLFAKLLRCLLPLLLWAVGYSWHHEYFKVFSRIKLVNSLGSSTVHRDVGRDLLQLATLVLVSVLRCALNKLIVAHVDVQGWRWVFGPRWVQFLKGSRGRKSPSGVQGRALGGGLGTKPPEAEETLQIVYVRKVFCVSHVVSKRA